jgi:hypothetical protein
MAGETRRMKDIDPIMKQTFLKDYEQYLTVIKLLETEQIEAERAIEQLQNLLQDVMDDMFIMDQETHDLFNQQKVLLGQENKQKKDQRRQSMSDPEDVIDERNQKRILLKYDVDKHKKLLMIVKKLAYERGWFR